MKWIVSGGVMVAAGLMLGGCARQQFAQPDARLPPLTGTPLPAGTDSITGTAGRHYNQHGSFHRFWLGQHYRTAWAAPVRAPVLYLPTAAPGGLRAGRVGGGYQSISMTLEGADGREYALRALDKEPYKVLSPVLRRTFLLSLVRDGTSAANPYGAFTVPPLARAAGVPHPTPRLVYVPTSADSLGEATPRFRGKLALLENKFESTADLTPDLAGAYALLDSEDMLKNIYQKPGHRIDQPAFLRARLLDVLLGDWDRHEGQWQWAAYRRPDGSTRYRAIPKDRDQVYYRFSDGVIPWVAARIITRFQTFGPRYHGIKGLVSQAHFIDQRGLPGLTRADFRAAALSLQQAITDSVIAEAAHQLPRPVFALEGPQLMHDLQARRDALPQAAAEFYEVLAHRPVLGGTTGPDSMVVRRWDDSTAVAIYGADGRRRYYRTFYAAETREITLEGIAGADVFEVHTASGSRGIRLNLYGGAGPDAVRATGPTRHLRLYDADATGNLRRRTVPGRHQPYDREADE